MDIIDMSVVDITSDLNRTKQTVEAHAGCLMQNKVNMLLSEACTSSFLSVPAPTLAPIAEAEEPNNDEAAQPKDDESEMDHATAIATTFYQSTIADDSTPISNSIATVTDSSIPSGSAPVEDSTLICNSGASVTDSITPTRPAASVTDSAITTRLAASNEYTVPTCVESVLASLIAATGQLMDVDTTGPAPPHAPDEIVP
ncbi:hypothetical protein J132_02635 [Termitomyces sp. J132]|nr:hypothetical protein J132_02635 [Termitomyces sp. J132]